MNSVDFGDGVRLNEQEKHAEDFLCLSYQIFELKIINFFNMC